MSDMSMSGAGELGPTMIPEDPAKGVDALLRAVRVMAENAATEDSAAEAKDYLAAALNAAQAIVVLDPNLNQQGVPLEHEIAMEKTRQDGQHRLEQARQAAAAPTPKKRLLRRTPDGYDMTEE